MVSILDGKNANNRLVNYPPARSLIIYILTHISVDTINVWSLALGRCDAKWMTSITPVSQQHESGYINPMILLGPKRRPIFFADLRSLDQCMGLRWPKGLDLDMVVRLIGLEYEGNVISMFQEWLARVADKWNCRGTCR